MGRYSVYLILALVWLMGSSLAGELKFFTSVESDLESINRETIKSLYLGREKFVGKKLVVITDFKDCHKEFLEKYIGREEKKYKALWRMMVFTGKSLAPKMYHSKDNLFNFISKKKNAIGYTTEEIKDPNFKVLKITD